MQVFFAGVTGLRNWIGLMCGKRLVTSIVSLFFVLQIGLCGLNGILVEWNKFWRFFCYKKRCLTFFLILLKFTLSVRKWVKLTYFCCNAQTVQINSISTVFILFCSLVQSFLVVFCLSLLNSEVTWPRPGAPLFSVKYSFRNTFEAQARFIANYYQCILITTWMINFWMHFLPSYTTFPLLRTFARKWFR